MTVNRYTQTAPSRFDPMSLQELMMVPGYKRENHDAILENIGAAETALAQVDPLAVHSEAAKYEQQKLYDQMQASSDKLNSEGFNPSAKSDFLRLNKEYQQAVGPNGQLGKIQAAKVAADTEKAYIMENAVKQGQSAEQTKKKIDEAFQKYQEQYQKDGIVRNFEGPLPPKYKNILEDMGKVKALMGTSITTSKGKEGYQITTDEATGMMVAITESGQVITENDESNVKAGLKALNADWTQPGGEGFAHAQWNDMSPEHIASVMNEGLGLMRTKKVQDTRGKEYKFIAAAGSATNPTGASSNYVTAPAKNIQRIDDALKGGIAEGLKGGFKVVPNDSNTIRDPLMGSSGDTRIKVSIENTLTDAQKVEYDRIYNILDKKGESQADFIIYDKYNPVIGQKIMDYMDSIPDILKQNVIFQDDVVKMYGDTPGTNTTSRKDIRDAIYTNRNYNRYGLDGEELAFDQLPEWVQLGFKDSSYVGFMSPLNGEGIGKQTDDDLYVAPHVMTVANPDNAKETVELMVGRTAGERNSPLFAADRTINKIYHTKYRPNEETFIEELGATVYYDSSFKGDDDTQDGKYIVSFKSGQRYALSDVEMQSAVGKKFGIEPKEVKKKKSK